MKQGGPFPTPGSSGSPGLPAPSTPYDLTGVHPGDARHSILEIRMSSSRSSGSRRGLPLPSRSSDSPLASRAAHRPVDSRERPRTAAGGSGGGSREGRAVQQDNHSDTDSDTRFGNVSRVLFRAGDLMSTSPSRPPPSGPHTPARQHQTPVSAGSTRLHPKSSSPSGPLLSSGASGIPAKHQTTGETSPTAAVPDDNTLQKAANTSKRPGAGRAPQPLQQKAAVSGAASAARLSKNNATTTPSTRDKSVAVDDPNSVVETRSGGTKRAASRSPSELGGQEARNKASVAEDDPFVQTPNKRARFDDAETAAADPWAGVSAPAALSAGIFSEVPLCVDAGALTGRLWCPVNMRNEPDPHWKEFPRNWNHPDNPGEGTCHISDLNYPDSSLPEWVHQDNAAHAAKGTLFASTMETLAWANAVIDKCGYDFEKDPLKVKIPKSLIKRLEAQPFTFPTTGKNPFMGTVLPFGWGPASDVRLLSRSSSELNPVSAGMEAPSPLPSTLYCGKYFRDVNNKVLRSGTVTPDETRSGTPPETPFKELGKGLVEFPMSAKKRKRKAAPANGGTGQEAEVGATEFGAVAVAQQNEGDNHQPSNETQADTEADATAGTNKGPEDEMEVEQATQPSPAETSTIDPTQESMASHQTSTAPETVAAHDAPQPGANIDAMDVEPASDAAINGAEQHLANHQNKNPLPANLPALSLYDLSNLPDGTSIAQALGLDNVNPAEIDVFAALLARAETSLPGPAATNQPQPGPEPQQSAYPAGVELEPSNSMPTLTAPLHPPELQPPVQPASLGLYATSDMPAPATANAAANMAGGSAAQMNLGLGLDLAVDPSLNLAMDPSLDLNNMGQHLNNMSQNPNMSQNLHPDPNQSYQSQHWQAGRGISVDRISALAVAGSTPPSISSLGSEVGANGARDWEL